MFVKADTYHTAFDSLGKSGGLLAGLGRVIYIDGLPFQDDYEVMKVGGGQNPQLRAQYLEWSNALAKAVLDFNLNPYQRQFLSSGGWQFESAVCHPELNALTEGTHAGAVPYSTDPAVRRQQESERGQAYAVCMASPQTRRFNPEGIIGMIRGAGDIRKFTGNPGEAYATPAQVAAANQNAAAVANQNATAGTPPAQVAPVPVPLTPAAAPPSVVSPAPAGAGFALPGFLSQEYFGVPAWALGAGAVVAAIAFSSGGRR